MKNKIAEGLQTLFKQRSEFIVLGLTGRTGSGCTSAAEILCKMHDQIELLPVSDPENDVHDRKNAIIHSWFKENWSPFTKISVSDIIVSFLFDEDESKLQGLLENKGTLAERERVFTEFSKLKEEYRDSLEAARSKANPQDLEKLTKTRKFFQEILPPFASDLRHAIGNADIEFLQVLGDNLRKSGSCYSSEPNTGRLFSVPDRVRWLIQILRNAKGAGDNEGRDYFVIDALRNPFEILYFRERIAPFYLMAINSPDLDRKTRLHKRDYKESQIKALDKKEYPEINKPLAGYDAFVSQNIQSCIEKADIYITNAGTTEYGEAPDLRPLSECLIKYVSLIQHPGLITPTRQERCMQVAYTAKINSGCISRQVGAVVTDQDYVIHAVGWNDVPLGQVPCLLRRVDDVIHKRADACTFSEYERKNKEFVTHLTKVYGTKDSVKLRGRNVSFCFKDAYNSIAQSKNQVHTRSLHAEENAFLQVSKKGGVGLEGGALFSTASPCELCSKKAYQLGIGDIYYIDPYPGISSKHVLSVGTKQPKMHLFVGAIGEAYHRLYTPILPYKDELDSLMA